LFKDFSSFPPIVFYTVFETAKQSRVDPLALVTQAAKRTEKHKVTIRNVVPKCANPTNKTLMAFKSNSVVNFVIEITGSVMAKDLQHRGVQQ